MTGNIALSFCLLLMFRKGQTERINNKNNFVKWLRFDATQGIEDAFG